MFKKYKHYDVIIFYLKIVVINQQIQVKIIINENNNECFNLLLLMLFILKLSPSYNATNANKNQVNSSFYYVIIFCVEVVSIWQTQSKANTDLMASDVHVELSHTSQQPKTTSLETPTFQIQIVVQIKTVKENNNVMIVFTLYRNKTTNISLEILDKETKH